PCPRDWFRAQHRETYRIAHPFRKESVRMAYAERRGRWWRVKYKKPDGTWASESGFETKDSALSWGRDQESDIRRNTWIDPEHAKERFGPFAEEVFEAVRVSATTRAKYRSHLDTHLLPQ